MSSPISRRCARSEHHDSRRRQAAKDAAPLLGRDGGARGRRRHDAAACGRANLGHAGIDPHIVVKVPFTKDGVKACKTLSSEGKRVNVTLCFSATQALLAAKVGATYISPFVGRLDDISTSGMHLIEEIVDIYRNYDFKTEVLVASVRHPLHVIEAARIGADICTCPAAVIESMFKHPLTDIGLEKFLKDWEKAQAVKA